MAVSPRTSTGFVGLQDYLNANQSAIDNTASALANNDQEQADAARGALDLANSQITPQTTDGTTLPGYADAQSKVNAADDAIKGLGTFGGISQQLQSLYGGKGDYTQGDRDFDAGLLSSSADARGKFQDAQSKLGGLDAYLKNVSEAGTTPLPSKLVGRPHVSYTLPVNIAPPKEPKYNDTEGSQSGVVPGISRGGGGHADQGGVDAGGDPYGGQSGGGGFGDPYGGSPYGGGGTFTDQNPLPQIPTSVPRGGWSPPPAGQQYGPDGQPIGGGNDANPYGPVSPPLNGWGGTTGQATDGDGNPITPYPGSTPGSSGTTSDNSSGEKPSFWQRIWQNHPLNRFFGQRK